MGRKRVASRRNPVGKTGKDLPVSLDIYSRLNFSLNKVSSESESSDSDEETVELRFTSRPVYVASLCLICMDRGRMLCDGCRTVSHCARHKSEARIRHQDLCDAFREIRRVQDGAVEATKLLSPQEYRVYRTKLLQILQSEVQRPLQLWEQEVVLYPRVCRLCRDTSKDLILCHLCSTEYFCENHREQHKSWCNEFRVFQRCLFLQHRAHEPVQPRIPSVLPESVQDPSFLTSSNLDQLFSRIYQGSSYYKDMDCLSYATLSHVSTIPLTALYAFSLSLPDLHTRKTLTVHVVGAEFSFEGTNLRVWEQLFLHFLPNLQHLSVILVGPELRLPTGVPVQLLSKVKLCRSCKSTKRTVSVQFHPGRCYHEVRLDRADLVCLFNPGLYRDTGFDGRDTWPETIRGFLLTRSPVLVTSYTEHEIPREIIRISSVASVEVLLAPARNPYASLKPDRNFVSDEAAPLIYKNYYLTIVRGR